MSTYSRGRVSFGKTGKQDIPIYTFMVQKSLYYNVPDRQRNENIWPYWKKQWFIDTILRGTVFMGIDDIVLNQEWETTEDGKERMFYSVEDGLQRLSTIYAFIDGKIRTFNHDEYKQHVLVDVLDTTPFGKRYEERDDITKQQFLAYPLPVKVTERASPEIAGERFRRRNSGTPISAGEDLRSYGPTDGNKLAGKITEHAIWGDMFKRSKRKDRKYHFEMALYIIYLAIHGFPAQMNKNTLKQVAAGREDTFITPEFEEAILSDLSNLSKLVQGTRFTAKTDGIPLWEAGILLKKATCNFDRSASGCLNNWFARAKMTPIPGRTYGNKSVFAGMTHRDLQQDFWAIYRSDMLGQDGLVFDDPVQWAKVRDASYAEVDPSIQALIHTNGNVVVPSDFKVFV